MCLVHMICASFMWDVPHSYVSFIRHNLYASFICEDVPHSYVETCLIHMCLIHMQRRSWFICASFIWEARPHSCETWDVDREARQNKKISRSCFLKQLRICDRQIENTYVPHSYETRLIHMSHSYETIYTPHSYVKTCLIHI